MFYLPFCFFNMYTSYSDSFVVSDFEMESCKWIYFSYNFSTVKIPINFKFKNDFYKTSKCYNILIKCLKWKKGELIS